jgi:hypothetical protein
MPTAWVLETEDKFHATYNGILTHGSPLPEGMLWIMGEGKPEYIIVRHAGGNRNPLFIVELKRPKKWTTAGKNEIWDDLTTYIEGRFNLTEAVIADTHKSSASCSPSFTRLFQKKKTVTKYLEYETSG